MLPQAHCWAYLDRHSPQYLVDHHHHHRSLSPRFLTSHTVLLIRHRIHTRHTIMARRHPVMHIPPLLTPHTRLRLAHFRIRPNPRTPFRIAQRRPFLLIVLIWRPLIFLAMRRLLPRLSWNVLIQREQRPKIYSLGCHRVIHCSQTLDHLRVRHCRRRTKGGGSRRVVTENTGSAPCGKAEV